MCRVIEVVQIGILQRRHEFVCAACGYIHDLTVEPHLTALRDLAWSAFGYGNQSHSDARMMLEQAQTDWDYSPEVLSVLCEQKTDNIFGIGFLFLGFVLQLIAAFGWDLSGFADTLILAAILVTLIAAMVVRGKLIQHCEAQAKSLTPIKSTTGNRRGDNT